MDVTRPPGWAMLVDIYRYRSPGALVSPPAQATQFFGKTYGEAMSLLVEARDYLAHREPIDRGGLAVQDRLRCCSETMRLTSRLTQVMAWLLAQRAGYEGGISLERALHRHSAPAPPDISLRDAATGKLPPRPP